MSFRSVCYGMVSDDDGKRKEDCSSTTWLAVSRSSAKRRVFDVQMQRRDDDGSGSNSIRKGVDTDNRGQGNGIKVSDTLGEFAFRYHCGPSQLIRLANSAKKRGESKVNCQSVTAHSHLSASASSSRLTINSRQDLIFHLSSPPSRHPQYNLIQPP